MLRGDYHEARRGDPDGRALADRHYSRQTPGAVGWSPPGEHFAIVSPDQWVWAAVRGLDPAGAMRWRVTIFRREAGPRASDIVRLATDATFASWTRRGLLPMPAEALTTEVNPGRVRHKRDPGRCFLRAGWRRIGVSRRGLVVFAAPGEVERGATLPAVEGGAA